MPITAALFVLLVLFSVVKPPPWKNRNANHRIDKVMDRGQELADNVHNDGEWTWTDSGDDVGSILLMAWALGSDEMEGSLPRRFVVAHSVFVFFGILLLWWASCRLLSFYLGTAFSLFIALSPHFRFLAYSTDVYCFTLFSLCAVWLLTTSLTRDHWSTWPKIVLLCLVIAFCSLFRSDAWHVALGIPFFLALMALRRAVTRKMVAKSLVAFLLIVGCYQLPSLFFERTHHVMWHSLHAGLFEFGGVVTDERQVFPYFALEQAGDYEVIHKFDRWFDQAEVFHARQVSPDVEIYSAEYESILKAHFLELVSNSPGNYCVLLLRRLWRVLNVNPWADHDEDSELRPSSFDQVFKVVVLVVLVWGFFVSRSSRFWPALVTGLPVTLSPMLVHSGYIMYNFATAVMILLAFCYSVFVLMERYGDFKPAWWQEHRDLS